MNSSPVQGQVATLGTLHRMLAIAQSVRAYWGTPETTGNIIPAAVGVIALLAFLMLAPSRLAAG
jgi:hypothetical protein